MATSRFEPYLLTEILRLFRDQIGAGNSWTAEEILRVLELGRGRRDIRHELSYLWKTYRFEDPEAWLTDLLGSLAELGLIVVDGHAEESSGFKRWRVADSWRPPPAPPRGDGGGGDNGGDLAPPAGDGDDDGGGGLREVLGHPVLFTLPRDEFARLVERLFDEVEP